MIKINKGFTLLGLSFSEGDVVAGERESRIRSLEYVKDYWEDYTGETLPAQGIKHDEGKPALDLIDPYFEEELAKVLTKGAEKYAVDNWQKGMSLGKALAGVRRHLLEARKGNYVDPESGLSHLAHAAAGLMFLHYFIRRGMTNVPDDRFQVKK